MLKRISFVLAFLAVLLSLIVYSKVRSKIEFVSGIIESDEIRLGSRVGGRVQSVPVHEGDEVQAGQALVILEPFDLNEREGAAVAELAAREAAMKKIMSGLRPEEVAQAKARYDQLDAQLKLIEAGPRPEEISAAESRLVGAEAAANLAKREFDRVSNLIQKNAAPKSEYDQADEILRSAIANVEMRKDELAILKSGSREQEIQQARANLEFARLGWKIAEQGSRSEEIEQAQAARDAAAANLAAVRQQIKELTISAPDSGIVDALDLQPGDLIGPNAPVLTMLATDNIWIRAYVPQQSLKLRSGEKLRVSVDSYPGEDFTGEVSFVSRQAEFTPGNVQTSNDRAKLVYRIRLSMDDPKHRLRPGMTVNVWLDPR